MWILAIINALGLVSGAILNEIVMYILFGISFVAFSHRYAQHTWRLIYERESQLVDMDGKANMKIANEITCFFMLAFIYWMLAFKTGSWCVPISTMQCVIFQLLKLVGQESKKDILVAVLFIVEFLFSILYLL